MRRPGCRLCCDTCRAALGLAHLVGGGEHFGGFGIGEAGPQRGDIGGGDSRLFRELPVDFFNCVQFAGCTDIASGRARSSSCCGDHFFSRQAGVRQRIRRQVGDVDFVQAVAVVGAVL